MADRLLQRKVRGALVKVLGGVALIIGVKLLAHFLG
jgi:hypothetical protein